MQQTAVPQGRPRVFVDTNIILEAVRTGCWMALTTTFSIETVEKCIEEALTGVDAVLLLTPWQEFLGLDPVKLRRIVASPAIIDGRNVLDPKVWQESGWRYYGMGRGVSIW